MKIIITRATRIGTKAAAKDEVVDASKDDAAILISMGKAVEATKENVAALNARKKAAASQPED